MEPNQLTQMVNWLDEELRSERGETAKLQQQVERQANEITDLARHIRELEGRVVGLGAQLTSLSGFDEALKQLKNEVVLMLQTQDEQHRKEQREIERLRMAEREERSRAISELRKELQRLPRYAEELRLREAEDRRLGEVLIGLRHEVAGMGKDFDERARNISYLTEQRAYDNKRIGSLQEEALTVLKRTEALDSRFKPLEDSAQRHERHIQELGQASTELRREQATWVESVRLDREQREREMGQWRQEVDAQRQHAKELVDRMQQFNEAAEAARQTIAVIPGFQEQIRRDQNQVAELQRLGAERQRKELEEWQAEEEKRWKKHELQWEHQWKEQYQRHSELVTRLADLEGQIGGLQQQLVGLWRIQEIESAHHVAESQRWQGELEKALAERDKQARTRG